MANAVFTATVETKVSLNLDGISLESWKKISDYIRMVVEAENILKGEALKGEIVLPPVERTKVPDIEKTSETPTSPEITEDPYKEIHHYRNHEDVIALFKDAEAHPSAYTWEWRPSKVWKSECPTLENASLHGVAHTLGSMYVHKLVQKSEKYNEKLKIYENLYRVPVPTKAEKTAGKPAEEETVSISPANLFRGRRLREARKEHHLTVGELAEMIGYDAAIINKWEWGLYTISAAAQVKLEECFGKELFGEEVA